MGLFTLIRDVTSAKVNAFTGSGATKPQHTAVPLNLHQGSAVQLPDLDLALAQADGSILPNVLGSQTITAVGKMRIFNLDVFHSYLADGTSFIRTVADGYNVKDVTLFTNKDEIIPATNEDWEFWLGRYQEMTDGSSTLAEAGLIGWPQFQVDGATPIVYNRSWAPSAVGIEPIAYDETIYGLDGVGIVVRHEGMEYSRQLTAEANSTVESLLVSLAQTENDASVNIYVGIALNSKDLKVLAAS